jgi:polyhydroxyalkanoate synthase
LGLHLAAATSIWSGSRAAWPLLSAAWPSSRAGIDSSLAALLQSAPPEKLAAAVDLESRARLDRFLTGLEAYRAHPYRRALDDPPVAWSEGNTRLLDFGGKGPPVLVVPSLVNKSYVLDLDGDSSMMRYMARHGLNPLLVDWGVPNASERGFTLTDYIAGRLVRALDAIGEPAAVLGYCMGGNLAVALAQLRAAAITGVALLATPWDFHAPIGAAHPVLKALGPALTAMIEMNGALSIDVLQSLFFSLDPTQSWAKFRGFAALDPESDAARRFVALEDWANDGVPLAGPVARECLFGWYGDNTPAEGKWRIAGEPVIPDGIEVPTLHVIPARDRIVPPESARALAAIVPGAEMLTPAAGHVGMAVGSRAESEVWQPVTRWLAALQN